MKKAFVWILLLSLLISAFVLPGVTAAAEGSENDYEWSYMIAKTYATTFARRDILSGGEAAAMRWLSADLSASGYEVSTPAFTYYGESTTGAKIAYNYNHVLGCKDNGKERCVVIGCYYGGFEPQDSYGVGNGASVALSVGTLLYIAHELSSVHFDFNLVIAFWGGMEIPQDFNAEKCGVPLDKIALYINLDCIGAGDCDYLYVDDVPRTTETYFRSVIDDFGADIKEPPVFKKQASLSYGENDPYSYTHLGLLSVNRFMMGAGVSCVNFLGGSWESDTGLYRYAGKGDIEGTSLDTIESINGLNGGEDKTKVRLGAVANVILRAVKGQGFSSAVFAAASETSSHSLDNSLAFTLISLIGTALLIGLLIFLLVKQGKDRREAVWEVPHDPFDGADPFAELHEKNSSHSSDDDDGDDVFRF